MSFGAGAQTEIRVGGEFQANRFTTDHQYRAAVAVDADGDFVVTWIDIARETNAGIFAARYSSAGVLLGGELHVNTYTNSAQKAPSVAAESNGDFVIAWQSDGQAGYAFNYSVFGRRFSSSGVALGVEFQVNSYTLGSVLRPMVGSDSDGDFVVVWQVNHLDGDYAGVFGRRFDSSGAALAAEFLVNSHTESGQEYPSVAVDNDGDFVVAWDDRSGHDGQGYGVFAQRFNSAGARVALEFQINTHTDRDQSNPSVAADAEGDFVVAWQSYPRDGELPGGSHGVFARRFSSAGTGLAAEFMVNLYTDYQGTARAAMDGSGRFVVTWQSRYQDGSFIGVFARRFSADGVAVGGEIQVNTYTTGIQWEPSIDLGAGGRFVIAWTSTDSQDGNGWGVFAQRFALPLATLDVDGNGAVEPLDGLLNVRHRFGFTGSALIDGALGDDCTRCEGAAITAYLDGLGLTLDIDNNGTLEALADGLLVLRFVFGFTGTSLTQGAVAPDCVTRCDSATIAPYLQTLD